MHDEQRWAQTGKSVVALLALVLPSGAVVTHHAVVNVAGKGNNELSLGTLGERVGKLGSSTLMLGVNVKGNDALVVGLESLAEDKRLAESKLGSSVEADLLGVLKHIEIDGGSSRELERLKIRLESDIVVGRDHVAGQAEPLGSVGSVSHGGRDRSKRRICVCTSCVVSEESVASS